MLNGFRAYFVRASHCVLPVVIVVTGISLSSALFAQTEVVPVAKEKKKVEPVFRVSKLASSPSSDSEKSVPANEDQPNLNSNQPINRVASTNMRPGNGIVGSTPVVTPDLPANTMEVPPSSIAPTPLPPAKTTVAPKRVPHPLDRAVDQAKITLGDMRAEVKDYTALMAKRELVNGVVGTPSYMAVKIRCPRVAADGSKIPFSIYMKFLRPKQSAGREVIWVDGQNEGKLVVHECGGLIGMRRIYLDPTGWLAMKGQRYPIYDAGLENLVVKLIEKAERDRAAGPCVVNYKEGATINKRSCSVIELIHNERRAPYEFHKAKVFIDDELNLPVRFAAYDWPTSPNEKPRLLEEYTYYNIKLNVGLTDMDFSPENPAYKFPRK